MILEIEPRGFNRELRLLPHQDLSDDRIWQEIIVWERKSWAPMKFHSMGSRGKMTMSQ